MAHLDTLIDRFLDDHRESDGGWAKITSDDVALLHEIIRELIELKCDKDADGDYPFQIKVINRRTHESMHYSAVPYRERYDANGDEIAIPFMDMLRILLLNLRLASDHLNNEIRCEEFRNQP